MSYDNTNPVHQSSVIPHFFTYGNAGVEIARVTERRLAEERRNRIAALRATPDRSTRARSLLSSFLVTIGTALLRESPAESLATDTAWRREGGQIRNLDPERSVS